jgi:hypothetical protein
LKRAAQLDPKLPFVHFYLGIAYRRCNQFAQGKVEFLEDLKIEPDVRGARCGLRSPATLKRGGDVL